MPKGNTHVLPATTTIPPAIHKGPLKVDRDLNEPITHFSSQVQDQEKPDGSLAPALPKAESFDNVVIPDHSNPSADLPALNSLRLFTGNGL